MQNINSVPAVPIINMEPKRPETEQQQVSFKGNTNQAAQTEEKNTHPVLKLITAAVVAVVAGASHKTYSASKALKEAGLKDSSKIKLSDIFLHNLNPVNWFSKAEASKALTDIECTKIGDSGKLFKTKDGDTVLLDRSKVFKVNNGESEDVEEFAKKAKPSDTAKPTETSKTEGAKTEETQHQVPKLKISDNIPPHINKATIEAIAKMPGSMETHANQITGHLLEDWGYSKDLVQPEFVEKISENESIFSPVQMFGGFDFLTGKLRLKKDYGSAPANIAAPMLAHELDHMSVLAKVCKSMGVDEYEKLVTSLPAPEGSTFNRAFWEKASQEAKLDDFDAEKYIAALKNYSVKPKGDPSGIYANDFAMANYGSNALEESAHRLQHEYEEALNIPAEYKVPTIEGIAPSFKKVDTALDNLIQAHPELELDGEKDMLYNEFLSRAIINANPNTAKMYQRLQAGEMIDIEAFQNAITQNALPLKSDFAAKAKILEAIPHEIQQQEINPEFIANTYEVHLDPLRQKVATPSLFTPEEQSQQTRQELKRINEKYLAFIKKHQATEPAQELKALLSKVHLDNEGKTSSMALNLSGTSNLDISEETRARIISNDTFKEGLAQLRGTKGHEDLPEPQLEESMLVYLLNQTKLSVF